MKYDYFAVLLDRINEAMYEKAFCDALAKLLLLHNKCDFSAMSVWGQNMKFDPINYHLGHPWPLFKFSFLAMFREQLDSHGNSVPSFVMTKCQKRHFNILFLNSLSVKVTASPA